MRKTAGRRCISYAPFEIIISRRATIKQTITFLRLTGRRIMSVIKKLFSMAFHQGTLKIGVTIGVPPLFSISLSYDAKFEGKADNNNKKVAKTG